MDNWSQFVDSKIKQLEQGTGLPKYFGGLIELFPSCYEASPQELNSPFFIPPKKTQNYDNHHDDRKNDNNEINESKSESNIDVRQPQNIHQINSQNFQNHIPQKTKELPIQGYYQENDEDEENRYEQKQNISDDFPQKISPNPIQSPSQDVPSNDEQYYNSEPDHLSDANFNYQDESNLKQQNNSEDNENSQNNQNINISEEDNHQQASPSSSRKRNKYVPIEEESEVEFPQSDSDFARSPVKPKNELDSIPEFQSKNNRMPPPKYSESDDIPYETPQGKRNIPEPLKQVPENEEEMSANSEFESIQEEEEEEEEGKINFAEEFQKLGSNIYETYWPEVDPQSKITRVKKDSRIYTRFHVGKYSKLMDAIRNKCIPPGKRVHFKNVNSNA